MKTIVITGGIGSGKSYISKKITEMYGIPCFDSDTHAKLIMLEPNIIDKVKILLGEDAYIDNTLNKEYISKAIYDNDELRLNLNKIISNRLHEKYDEFKKDYDYCLYECAIFFELGLDKKIEYEYAIGVMAKTETRIRRIKARNGWGDEKIAKIIAVQMSNSELMDKIDLLISNDDGSDVEKSIKSVFDNILK